MTEQERPDLSSQDPDWWRQAVVYQVYPRSFADSDGNGVGDLPGVTRRLGHLADLGVDALWLSPFYPSAWKDGGYDVADYRDVDPLLGTLDDFDELSRTAHALGLKVLVDIVPNHSSDLHPWFREALAAAPGSPARDRYIFRRGRGPGGGRPPSDWEADFGGSAWQRLPDGEWYLHLYTPEQPDFNWANEEVREDFRRTLRFWADRGVDGFRIDVAHGLAKDLAEPLRDLGPGQRAGRDERSADGTDGTDGTHPYTDRDEVHEIYRDWRLVLDSYTPPRMAVAEAWVKNSRRVLYTRQDELGQAFNFEFLQSGWSAPELRAVIGSSLEAARAAGASATWVLSNHDVVRHASRLALPPGADPDAWLMSGGTRPAVDPALGLRRARAATLLMLALPGSSYLYQGEELGLPEVADLPPGALRDPVWEQTGHTRKGRDGCRVPLPWTPEGPSYGFGPDGAWLPQPASFGPLSAAAQRAAEEAGAAGTTLGLYRAALRLRGELLGDESLVWHSSPEGVLDFGRSSGWRSVTNLSATAVAVPPGEQVLCSAGPVPVSAVAPDTTVWLR
ncbi:glycoside hydrolase family 13 protein [Streptomyces sp. NPDC050560]|uniref:glycoside hydrolase family 13 protein n=1 Tax=Streptomyces sp. NPDC050560 TaxID=3365630 RepID=UPI0037AA2F6D